MKKFKYAKSWNKTRYKQLEEVKRLLNDLASFENGNNAIFRLRQYIKMAAKLSGRNRCIFGRRSFVRFLEDLALVEIEEPQS